MIIGWIKVVYDDDVFDGDGVLSNSARGHKKQAVSKMHLDT